MTDKPIAYYSLSAVQAIVIYNIEYGIEDKVIVAIDTGNVCGKRSHCTIRHDADERAYFRTHGYQVYLDDCMKVSA